MPKDNEEIFQIKPTFFGFFTVDFLALLRKMFGKRQTELPNPITNALQRFVDIFAVHGVAISEIPRLIPEISLHDLQTENNLLKKLKPKVIDKVAALFGVRREWLEGISVRMYQYSWLYKMPDRLFEELKTLDVEGVVFPLVALCSNENFYKTKRHRQNIVLVLQEKCAEIGGRAIFRYRVFNDGMDWNYWKSNIQLKNMIRVYCHFYKPTVVPIFQTDEKTLTRIMEGRVCPGPIIENGVCLHGVSLEDFSLFPDESAASNNSGHPLECSWNNHGGVELLSEVEMMLGRKGTKIT